MDMSNATLLRDHATLNHFRSSVLCHNRYISDCVRVALSLGMNDNKDLSYYRHKTPITTRWSDNDQYGHMNNSIYYHLFDALVNAYLIQRCGLNPQSTTGEDVPGGGPIGLVVSSGCRYHAAVEFPDALTGGLTISHLGRTSVTYHCGIFKGDAKVAAATGYFTHVFVDPRSRRPTQMTKKCRDGFLAIATDEIIHTQSKL